MRWSPVLNRTEEDSTQKYKIKCEVTKYKTKNKGMSLGNKFNTLMKEKLQCITMMESLTEDRMKRKCTTGRKLNESSVQTPFALGFKTEQ